MCRRRTRSPTSPTLAVTWALANRAALRSRWVRRGPRPIGLRRRVGFGLELLFCFQPFGQARDVAAQSRATFAAVSRILAYGGRARRTPRHIDEPADHRADAAAEQ